ncbi:DUF6817 domain-containing protein [Streptomyces sp. NPDC058246]|uniref:DUF6817 domain-containing protein n=1 Tax=Streptomyces sp. NPDC058246 TaxID=3346400 RepID=UPI0036E846A3
MHLQHSRRYFRNSGTFAHTDGFATALLPGDRRADLAAVIGAEAEGIVYLYASCDRKGAYPDLTRPDAAFLAARGSRACGAVSASGPSPQTRRACPTLHRVGHALPWHGPTRCRRPPDGRPGSPRRPGPRRWRGP